MQTPTPSLEMRYARLDAWRGTWMVWMAAFHLAFDLAHYRLIDANFYVDALWTTQRTLILSGFLFWAGWSQGLALAAGQSGPRFARRWLQIAGAACLVSVGSSWMFPNSWISFGVLHAFALLLPVLRWAGPHLPTPALVGVAALAVALPALVQHPVFDSRWTNWVGLVTHKPITEDFVPVLPWVAPLLLGLAAARSPRCLRLMQGPLPEGGLGRMARGLAALGRWPLSFYLLHQPVLLAALLGGLWLWRSA